MPVKHVAARTMDHLRWVSLLALALALASASVRQHGTALLFGMVVVSGVIALVESFNND